MTIYQIDQLNMICFKTWQPWHLTLNENNIVSAMRQACSFQFLKFRIYEISSIHPCIYMYFLSLTEAMSQGELL